MKEVAQREKFNVKNGEPQLHNKSGRLITLDVIKETENGEPQAPE